MKWLVLVGVAIAAGCPKPSARTQRSPIGDPIVAAAPQQTPSCRSPELWLALYPRDGLDARYCQACAAYCDVGDINVPEQRRGTEPHMRWDFLHGDLLRFGCADLEYAQRAVSAYHGATFTDEPWASYFKSQPWYRPRAVSSLPSVAADNERWLAAVVEVCKRTYLHGVVDVYAADIRSWFEQKAAGKVRLAPSLFVDHQPATEEQFLEFLRHGGDPQYFQYELRTPIRAGFGEHWASRFPGRQTLWDITVSTGSPTLSCVRQSSIDCEGYESVTFIYDAATNELVGLHVTAAG
jgi:hypothetical protein